MYVFRFHKYTFSLPYNTLLPLFHRQLIMNSLRSSFLNLHRHSSNNPCLPLPT
uniref:Uncharacterized protein n=1 Tax=Octopus bimaculoides TaxID=37653 RepID=A0A0L8I0X8_OCTBM